MKRSNRGFTLVEVVFAVTIAVLVSVAAASVILVTRSGMNEAIRKNNAVCQASAILECFKASNNLSTFKEGLEFTYLDGSKTFSMSGAEEKIFFLYFKKSGEIVNNITYFNENTLERCDYFVCMKFKDCQLNAGEWTFIERTTLDVAVYEKANVTDEFDPFDNTSDAVEHETQLIYTPQKSCSKGRSW